MFKILASVIFDDILNIKKEAETIAYCLFLIPYPHQKTFSASPISGFRDFQEINYSGFRLSRIQILPHPVRPIPLSLIRREG